MLSKFLIFIILINTCFSVSNHPLLLVIGFDGMRYDYINSVRTPFLWSLTKSGVFAPNGIQNQMFTLTGPNFYTISTGLYEENHGIIGNTMYDPVFDTFFDYFQLKDDPEAKKDSRDDKWYKGEPIWQMRRQGIGKQYRPQTNDKNKEGRLSGAMRWPFCAAKINGKAMDRCVPVTGYTNYSVWIEEIDTMVGWFTDKDNPINLGLYYNLQPDHAEHGGDIYRQANQTVFSIIQLLFVEVSDTIKQLDDLMRYLFEKLDNAHILEKMNFLFVADHGFTNVYKEFNYIDIDQIIDPNDYFWSSRSIFPKKGVAVSELYKKLKEASEKTAKFDVWLKEDVPEDFHYKNNRRIGPIVVSEKLGYSLTQKSKKSTSPKVRGKHGYSKFYPEMRPFFMAFGPAFKKNFKLEFLADTTDYYSLMSKILEVTPCPNDGKFNRIKSILMNSANRQLQMCLGLIFATIWIVY